MIGTFIPFPHRPVPATAPRLRIVAAPVEQPAPEQVEPVLVDHGGHTYRSADLMAHLSPAALVVAAAAAARSGQAIWDEVVRRWSALAESGSWQGAERADAR